MTYFDGEIVDRKIRCIKDNLARKSVDFRTKLRCWEELKMLYGLKHGEDGKLQAVKGKKGFQTMEHSSEASTKLSQDKIAKEVGFSAATMGRAEIIEKSDLPEKVKAAAFDGRLSIRPIYELAGELAGEEPR